jgi:polysaccharide deacetylase family protein (PEP-CTERM system associated)
VFRLGPEGFRADVRRARRALEQAGGRAVYGYRAPIYSIRPGMPWAFTILAEEGHTYDSSIHPIAHDRYGVPAAPRFAHRLPGDSGLWEVPVGTARALGTNLPVGGGFFRLFPAALLREAIASVNRRDRQPLVLYVHPWEFDPDQPRPAMPWAHRFRHYVGLAGAERKLAALLAAFRFTTIEAALAPVTRAPEPAVARAS